MKKCYLPCFNQICASIILLVCIIFCAQNLEAQNQSTINFFGKNRIQFDEKKQDWSFLRAENYDVYFTQGGRELATYTARVAQNAIHEVEEFLNYRGPSKYQIIIYNTLGDAMQTNLGFDLEQYNTGGFTRITGAKIILNFNGSRSDFDQQLRAGIAQVLINDMLYGGNIQERIQNSTLIYLPEWYISGFIAFFEKEWTTKHDGLLRTYFVKPGKPIKRFSQLLLTNELLAGQSFWHYIAETYGKSTLTNVIYLTRVNRDAESALQYVLGKSLKTLSSDWYAFYNKRYTAENPPTDTNNNKNKNNLKSKGTISKAVLSPDASMMAYVSHKNGINTISIIDYNTNKTYHVHKSGLKYLFLANQEQYPIITWHPSGKNLAFFYENKARVFFGTINVKKEKDSPKLKFEQNEYPILRFDQVLQANYSPDGQHIAVSAARVGQSDIYLYHVPSKRVIPITQDHFDDFDPVFIENGGRILFSSNRTIDSLVNNLQDSIPYQKNLDLFAFNLNRNQKKLFRVTNTPYANETNPIDIGTGLFSYLSDESGIVSRHLGRLDSIENFYFLTDSLGNADTMRIVTDLVKTDFYKRFTNNVTWQQKAEKRNNWVSLIATRSGRNQLEQGKFLLDSIPFNLDSVPKTAFQKSKEQKKSILIENKLKQQLAYGIIYAKTADSLRLETELKADTVVTADYFFQVETFLPFLDEQIDGVFAAERNNALGKDPFRQSRTRIYNTNFRLDYLITQVGNNNFQNQFPNFIISSANNLNQRLGLIVQGGTSDLFENHRFTGGALLSSDFNNNQYFLVYESLKKRIDKKLIFNQFRSVQPAGFGFARYNAVEVMGSLIYPFNPFASIRMHGIYKRDRTDLLATDIAPLIAPTRTENWAGARIEYIHDNTVNKALNILYGTRYKIFAEVYRNLNEKQSFMTVFGVDYRTYQKIYKTFIWANRFAANYSLGQNRILYYLGGVDNWFLARFNESLTVPQGYDFRYNALGTNMRGFIQNARNGSNYFVFNSELRLPIFPVLSRSPISSDFLRNLQLVGFADVGTAWTGFNPFSRDNPFNVIIQENGPVKVTVFTNRDPLLFGYGAGLRMRLFGYFIRTDLAWGIDDGVRAKKPQLYISLALDF